MGSEKDSELRNTNAMDCEKTYEPNQRRVTTTQPFKLSHRDFKILRFVLEMKFASATHLHELFFATTLAGVTATSTSWSERRLRQLERAGYLIGEFVMTDRRRYFIATNKAHRAVLLDNPSIIIAKPKKQITYEIFRHDKFVLESRLQLGRDEKVTGWISDSALSAGVSMSFDLGYKFAPDAIYTRPCGENVAFELEIATKSKAAYRRKIDSLVHAMRSESSLLTFNSVHVRCLTLNTFRIWKEETAIYGELFRVEHKDMIEKNNQNK